MNYFSFAKGMTVMAIAFAAASCSHETDLYDQSRKEKESTENFKNFVLGGREVDPSQTWSTSSSVQLTINSVIAEGTLKVYAASPVGQNVAPIYVGTIAKQEQKTITVACPNDVTRLYVAVYDSQNYMRYETVNVTGSDLKVSFDAEEAAARNMTRGVFKAKSYSSSFNFPSMADDENFLSAVPYGVKSYDEVGQYGYAIGTSYIDESHTGGVNIWGNWDGSKTSGGKLYIKGYNDYSNRQFYVAPNTEVYLIEGATLIISAGDAGNLQGGDNYYIAKGAKIIAKGELKVNNGLHMYNKGTIEAPKLSVNNNSLLYNANMVKVDGEISVENNQSVIVNDNEITAGSMHTAGSGHFLNTGKCEISGQAFVNSNNNSWVNNGYYHCNNFKYEGGSWNVINNCKLVCDEDFYMNLGQNQGEFKLDGSVEAKNMFHGIGYTKMTGKSIFKIAETITCHADADGCYFGFYGPETDANGYAVVQAKKITATSLTQRRSITYRNYLIVATNNHWEQCDKYDSSVNGNYPYWDQGDNVKMSLKSKDDITETIEATECNAGISGKSAIVIEEPTMYYYYAFEDLGTTDDFDFNDVIVRLSAPVKGESTLEIVAAGGTMETYVTYGEGSEPIRVGAEVHSAMGASSVKTMVNTDKVDTNNFAILGTIEISDNAKVDQLPIGIEVKGSKGETVRVTRKVETGRSPLVIVVSGDENGKWFWPTERVNITAAYSDFGEWGANVSNYKDWYRTPSGSVVNY